MDIILINTMSNGLLNSIKYFIFNKKDKNIIIDPFSCIIKLSLLSYQTEGTKISINENQIFFNEPSYGQGIIRYLYGDGREDLHNLFKPIQKSVEWYKIPSLPDIDFLFNRAILGLIALKKSYGKYETIQHTIDYYITILNGNLTSINIEDMTQSIINSVTSKQEQIKSKQYQNDNNINNNNINNNNNNNDRKYHKNNKSQRDKIKNREDEPLIKKDEINSGKNNNDCNDDNNQIKTNDLELFLKNLWSNEEVIIVINLFKEFNKKNESTDQKFIFDSIINYCMMKENNLHNHIEERSSILE
jgi:hypothetical protein